MRIGHIAALLAALWLSAVPVAASAQDAAEPPSNADVWRDVRQGVPGTVSIPDRQAGVLIQSEGETWRAIRNGPLSVWGAWLLGGALAALAAFYLLRGRIRLEHGWSGRKLLRFDLLERGNHWLTAGSFILLALTGLNMLYGRYVLLPLIGPAAFADLTQVGKYLHNYLGLVFTVGILMMLLLWVRENIPARRDIDWLRKGGGMFGRGVHPPATKFNAGQKMVFWAVVLLGGAIALTGFNLLFPFYFADMQAMQWSQILHAALSVVLIAVIFAHIYIGTLGMEGAFDAMWSGEVDESWAREHHALWVEEVERETHSEPAPVARAPVS